jgi:hypothetical protein
MWMGAVMLGGFAEGSMYCRMFSVKSDGPPGSDIREWLVGGSCSDIMKIMLRCLRIDNAHYEWEINLG